MHLTPVWISWSRTWTGSGRGLSAPRIASTACGNRTKKHVSGVPNQVLTAANRAKAADQPLSILAWRAKTRGEKRKRAWARAHLQAADGDGGAAGGGAGERAERVEEARGERMGRGRAVGGPEVLPKSRCWWGSSPRRGKVVSSFGARPGWYLPRLRRRAGESDGPHLGCPLLKQSGAPKDIRSKRFSLGYYVPLF